MRLTTRGWSAISLVVLAVVLAWAFGQRSLNAVAAPTVAALLAASVLVWRAESPTVTYDQPRPGFPGERRTLGLSVEGSGIATVAQSLPEGITGRPVAVTTSLPATLDRTVTLEGRGVHTVGPPVVRQRDPLGLLERRVETDATAELLVYPAVYALADSTLGGLLADPATPERQEFDRLREYTHGDPLKDVHWKSSAKYDEFLVMEFAPSDRSGTVHVLAEGPDGDELATAAATVALAVLEAGLAVELTVPGGSLPPAKGSSHREQLLELLARTEPGSVEETVRGDPDVTIHARADETVVELPAGRRSFESLVVGHEQPRDSREVIA